jgi:hypothetical protein
MSFNAIPFDEDGDFEGTCTQMAELQAFPHKAFSTFAMYRVRIIAL